MATYKSEQVDVNRPAEQVYDLISNPENLRDLIENAPADKLDDKVREQIAGIEFTPDSVTIPGGPVGSLVLRADGNTRPTLVRFRGEGTPVPVALRVDIIPIDAENCQTQVIIDLEIPMMLKPMVNGPLQKMVDQIGTLLRQLRV